MYCLLPLNDDEGTLTSMQDLTLLGCRVFGCRLSRRCSNHPGICCPLLFLYLFLYPVLAACGVSRSLALPLPHCPCSCPRLCPVLQSLFVLFVSCVVVSGCVCVYVLVVVCLSMFLFLSCGICRMWGQSFAGLAPAACSHFRPHLPYQFTLIPTHNAHSTST